MHRRTFITGVAASAFALATPIWAKEKIVARQQTKVFSGNHFKLSIDETLVNITGKERIATCINGMLPAPTLVWREGDEVRLDVTNNLKEDSSIHWHGIILPNAMDGVPGLTFDGIKPGQTFRYRFKVRQSGTYWYHSHSGFQEQTGVHGAIVIVPKEEILDYDREYVVFLSDWSDEDPHTIYRHLKVKPDYYNYNKRTVFDFFEEVKQKGFAKAFKDRKMWNEMRMSDRDLLDVTGATYTYLINGAAPATNMRFLYQKGERIRLRFINGSAMSFFDVRIPGLKMEIVAADGNYIKPVKVDEFRIGVAETYDVIVEPEGETYAIFAQAMDRSGYALASLTTDVERPAPAPKMDPKPHLEMIDMGMMHVMDGMSSHKMKKKMVMEHKKTGKDLPRTPLAQRWDFGTTMRVKHARNPLQDPGVGLRNNGRRVLVYGDLETLVPLKEPDPTREIVLHLTGNMERFMWSINGIPYKEADPIKMRYNERVRVTFVNDTMMNHPMHLHGLWSDLLTGGKYVRKHTVIVQPASKISFDVTADAKGRWAFHCHLLYHMLDMFREVRVG
jgi:CopA family copper-resistance protein